MNLNNINLNSINEVILAYETDIIDTDTLLQILEAQPIAIAIWIDGVQGYNYSRQQTLKGLYELKKYIDAGHKYPIFFPEIANTSSGFSFNDTLNNGKDC